MTGLEPPAGPPMSYDRQRTVAMHARPHPSGFMRRADWEYHLHVGRDNAVETSQGFVIPERAVVTDRGNGRTFVEVFGRNHFGTRSTRFKWGESSSQYAYPPCPQWLVDVISDADVRAAAGEL